MVVVDLAKDDTAKNGVASGAALEGDLGYQERLLEITNRVHAAGNIDEILIDLQGDITRLFDAERLTIYVVDGIKKDLVSRVKSGEEITEIRVPISTNSLAGYAAYKGRLLNINNVYNEDELGGIDPKLKFDRTWDEKTGFRTRQVLVAPVNFQKYLMGAIQLINRKDGTGFSEREEEAVQELAQTLGIALFNQKRMAKARPGKFDYLIENGFLTQKELDKGILEARKTRQEIEDLLQKAYKVTKKDIGQALSHYYKAPFVEFNERLPIPGDLLAGLKVPFMRKNCWVPLGQDKEGRQVII
ncbi:MAG: GAF domain-containing protein, partial [Deltaproteobacteria bacterium]|nr:GAF domain-containing protein [Deltaproteobacteria bacterium]